MKNLIKKHWDIILLSIIVSLIIILNAQPNYVIMGLDNASPYFGIGLILERIKGTSSIIYGGLIYQLPLISILSTIGLSASLISNIYLFLNLITGVIGVYLLVSSLTPKKLPRFIASIIFLTSLFTIWIFSQPNFLFTAAYGSIPMIIYFLGKEDLKLYEYIFLTIFSISFLTTSLNLVAFFLYILQILILVKILSPKKKISSLLLWTLCIILFWIISLQIVKLVNGDYSFLLVNVFAYIKDLLNNSTVKEVSKGIIESEKTNSLVHIFSYSLGWMELHDTANIPIFNFYATYRENLLYLLLGAIPTLTALITVFKVKSKQVLFLTISLIIFLFISSKYGILIIERIPYISDALRWASSKLWPLFIIPIIALNTIFLSKLSELKSKVLIFAFSVLLTISSIVFSIPIYRQNLLSRKTLVNIPKTYFELPKNSEILILPEPQSMYMREYDWGYYGSDFLSYINNSTFVDQANLYETGMIYNKILETNKVPDYIDYILYDKSVQNDKEYNTLLDGFKDVKSNKQYTLYGRQ